MSTTQLHPPRLAAIFAASPSAPGTPVHSIQTMRRKAAGHSGPLTKILVANRGVRSVYLWSIHVNNRLHGQEIAIRVFRTAHELAMHTVAIYSFEDRLSAHRQKVRNHLHQMIVSSTINYLVRWSISGWKGTDPSRSLSCPRRYHQDRSWTRGRYDPPRVNAI